MPGYEISTLEERKTNYGPIWKFICTVNTHTQNDREDVGIYFSQHFPIASHCVSVATYAWNDDDVDVDDIKFHSINWHISCICAHNALIKHFIRRVNLTRWLYCTTIIVIIIISSEALLWYAPNIPNQRQYVSTIGLWASSRWLIEMNVRSGSFTKVVSPFQTMAKRVENEWGRLKYSIQNGLDILKKNVLMKVSIAIFWYSPSYSMATE